MTHQNQSNELNAAVQLLATHGFEGMANAMQILFNEAMQIERTEYLNAEPYQRTDERKSYANGFKDKSVNTRLGKLDLRVPQTRDSEFYPSALERGERSERALKLSVSLLTPSKCHSQVSTSVKTARLIESGSRFQTEQITSIPRVDSH